MEETLVRIWCEVLKLNEVGIHDNFFELGGDSILSIQIVASQSGRTAAGSETRLPVPDGGGTGSGGRAVGCLMRSQLAARELRVEVALTPIQRWFFAQNLAQPHHWNQSLLFEVRQHSRERVLRQ